MTGPEEHLLYLKDRAAWARYVAPRWRTMLERASESEKRRLWDAAGDELRAELRAMKSQERAA